MAAGPDLVYGRSMSTRRAVLMIADIGGYTEYMQFHRSVLGHAEAATSRMLDKVVSAARGFDLIEIEGDAAFLSRDAAALANQDPVQVVTSAAVAMHGQRPGARRAELRKPLGRRDGAPARAANRLDQPGAWPGARRRGYD